jgi:hypothetical protein
MATISQRSFTGGEITPSLYSRTDFVKYQTSAKKLKNFIPLKYGGISNRPGFKFLAEAGVSNTPVRLIPFEISGGLSCVLEFGHEYMRVYSEGAQVTYGDQTITGFNWTGSVVTHTGVFTGASDEVVLSGFNGDLGNILNGRNFRLNVLTGTTFELLNLDGSAFTSVDQPTYTSGGVFNEVYELVTSYDSADLFNLQFAQNLTNLVIVGNGYNVTTIRRTSNTEWNALTATSGVPRVDLPAHVTAYSHTVVGAAGAATYSYIVTCEYASVESDYRRGVGYTSTDPNRANPATRNYSNFSVSGANATLSTANYNTLNGRVYAANDNNDFPTASVNVIFNFYKGDTTKPTNTLVDPIDFGYIGSSIASWDGGSLYYEASFNDIGFTPDLTINPPYYNVSYFPATNSCSPYVSSTGFDLNPSAVAFAQQRLFLANDSLYQESIWGSELGAFSVFYPKTPSTDSTAVAFRISGAKYNPVKHIVPLSKLVVLTENSEFVINPDGSSITPTNINILAQSYNGSSGLKPLVINDTCLYVQSKGSAVRDLSFEFNIDGFTGNEISIFANHLFEGYELLDWCYQKTPNSVVWAVRSDGVLLSMTYLKEQQVLAWAQHDTSDGLFKSVCSIPGLTEDEVYVVVERDSVRYVEKLSTRFINERKSKVVTEYGTVKTKYYNDAASVPFLDHYLTYDGRNAVFSFTIQVSSYLGGGFTTEDTVTLTASASLFTTSDVGNEFHLYDSENNLIRFQVTTYVSATVVRATPIKNVPAEMQGQSTSHWSRAVDVITGLWHLEGQDVAVQADGYVDANPLNDSYTVITVEDGSITLPTPRALVHVGLPYTSDMRSLEIDTAQGETTIDKKTVINEVNMYVEKTRGLWAGAEEPEAGDYKGDLTELKLRSTENYETAVLKTGPTSTVIKSVSARGEVFIRQLDPAPATILSLHPSGSIPLR